MGIILFYALFQASFMEFPYFSLTACEKYVKNVFVLHLLQKCYILFI